MDASDASLVSFGSVLAPIFIFAESSRIFVLHTGCVLKIIESIFLSVFSVFLFYVAVCDVTWSAQLPEGSIFML